MLKICKYNTVICFTNDHIKFFLSLNSNKTMKTSTNQKECIKNWTVFFARFDFYYSRVEGVFSIALFLSELYTKETLKLKKDTQKTTKAE